MKLLLDEMHSPAVAADLRVHGYDVVAVKERAELMGLLDNELLLAARAEGRAVVTENVKDFAALGQRSAAAGDQHAGLVFTHPRRFPRAARNHVQIMSQALAELLDEKASVLREGDSFVWWLEKPKR